MSTDLIEILVSSGFTPGEAKTYLALTALGTSTVGPIVEHSNVSASKVYSILDRLMSKGLVTLLVEEGVKKFTATQPEMILTYLDGERSKLDDQTNKIQSILPELNLKKNTTEKKPIVEVAIGKKGFETIYTELIDSGKTGQTYLGLGGKVISFKLQSFWYPFSLKMAKNKISQRLIYENHVWYNKDPAISRRSERPSYYPMVLPDKYKNLPNILILGEKAVISGVDEEENLFSLIIRNKHLTETFRKLVEMISDLAVVPPNYSKYEGNKKF